LFAEYSIVIDLQILANTDAYHTLEENLKKMGFERAENDRQQKLSWRWQTRTEHGALMVLEFLADAPEPEAGCNRCRPTGRSRPSTSRTRRSDSSHDLNINKAEHADSHN